MSNLAMLFLEYEKFNSAISRIWAFNSAISRIWAI
jgi:hypothetical protein